MISDPSIIPRNVRKYREHYEFIFITNDESLNGYTSMY